MGDFKMVLGKFAPCLTAVALGQITVTPVQISHESYILTATFLKLLQKERKKRHLLSGLQRHFLLFFFDKD